MPHFRRFSMAWEQYWVRSPASPPIIVYLFENRRVMSFCISWVRAPSSPPQILKHLESKWRPTVTVKSGSDKGSNRPATALFCGYFSSAFLPRSDTIILTTLLCAARLFEFTALLSSSPPPKKTFPLVFTRLVLKQPFWITGKSVRVNVVLSIGKPTPSQIEA